MKKSIFNNYNFVFRAFNLIHSLEKKLIGSIILASLFQSILPYVNLIFISLIINGFIYKSTYLIAKYAIYMISIEMVFNLFIDILNKDIDVLSKNIDLKLKFDLQNKIMKLNYADIENSETINKIHRANYILARTGGYYAFINYTKEIIISVINMISSLYIVFNIVFSVSSKSINSNIDFFINSPLSIFIILIFGSVINIYLNRLIFISNKITDKALFDEKTSVESQLNYFVENIFLDGSIQKQIRIFSTQNLISKKYTDILNRSINFYSTYYFNPSKKRKLLSVLLNSSYFSLVSLIVLLKAINGSITIGEITKYIGVITLLNTAINNIIKYNQKILLQSEFIDIFEEFMKLPDSNSTKSFKKAPKCSEYTFEFKNVFFKYPESEDYILKGINLKLNTKTKYALVGLNGAGKTTLIKLLCRLYIPSSGQILINGEDISQYSVESYTDLISVIFQDFNIYPLNIAKNISCKEVYSLKKILNIIKKISLYDKIFSMDNNILTELVNSNKNAIALSGGENQKIAIARALYKDSKFTILDEPTAALDPKSESEIYALLNNISKDKGCMYISHRMSSCIFCDYIIVLDSGKITQIGNHSELINKKDGIYYKLFTEQAKNY